MPFSLFMGTAKAQSGGERNDGVADVGRIDKDRGAGKGFLFLHSLRSYRFPRHSSSQAASATWPVIRERQTPLKAEEPVYVVYRGLMLEQFATPRAGDGNRTRMASLEGWSSTIELHPQSGLLRCREGGI